MKITRHRIQSVIAISLIVFACCTACAGKDTQEDANKQVVRALTVWYSDANMQQYLESAAKAYEDRHGISVECQLHDSKAYLEEIYDADMAGENMPDVYLLRHDKLGRACMEGLAAQNTSKLYTQEKYCNTALLSAQYQDQLMAYPLCYDTVCMVYNLQSFPQAPASMGAINAFAQTGEVGENVRNILYWDINDYFSNAAFVQAYMDIGGAAGDDETVLSIANDQTGGCLAQYRGLIEYYAIDGASVDQDDVPAAFVEGRALCILASGRMLKTLDWYASQGMGVDYEVCAVPPINGDYVCCPASYTELAVVNGFGLQQDASAQFASFLTYDYADELYPLVGCFAARRGVEYENVKLSRLYEIYEQSKQFPKLPQTEDLQLNLELLFENVRSGGDIMAQLQDFSQKMQLRMNR